jgi:hypothetical protein
LELVLCGAAGGWRAKQKGVHVFGRQTGEIDRAKKCRFVGSKVFEGGHHAA